MSRQMRTRLLGLALIIFGVIALVINIHDQGKLASPTSASPSAQTIREIHLFTVEYKAKINNQEAEVYRWNPGQIVIHQGETVRLYLHGFNGQEHHFSIPDFKIQGTIKKGQVTTVQFVADRLGTFELICHDHLTRAQGGPMIAYIEVVR